MPPPVAAARFGPGSRRLAWLDLAHRRLDEAVFAAYGWEPSISDEEILTRLLKLNLERAAAS